MGGRVHLCADYSTEMTENERSLILRIVHGE